MTKTLNQVPTNSQELPAKTAQLAKDQLFLKSSADVASPVVRKAAAKETSQNKEKRKNDLEQQVNQESSVSESTTLVTEGDFSQSGIATGHPLLLSQVDPNVLIEIPSGVTTNVSAGTIPIGAEVGLPVDTAPSAAVSGISSTLGDFMPFVVPVTTAMVFAGHQQTGGSGASTSSAAAVPVYKSLSVNSNGGQPGAATLVLTYDKALDVTHLPLASAFKVQINGVENPVQPAVVVSGDTVTLKLTNAVAAGSMSLSVDYTDPTTGDDANAIQDSYGNDAATLSLVSGVVADGYIRGASVYIDTNNDGQATSADYFVGETDAAGRFFISKSAPLGKLLVVGGVNIDTGLNNTMTLKAPTPDLTKPLVINPLTTVITSLVSTTVTAAQAAAQVAVALGLNLPAGEDLLSIDPISAAQDQTTAGIFGLAAQKAAAMIASIVTLASSDTSATAATSDKVIDNLATVLKTAANAAMPAAVNLADNSILDTVLSGAISTIAATSLTGSSGTLANAVRAISAANSLDGVSSAQSQFLARIVPDAPTSLVAALTTNDATPEVRVNLNVSSLDGKAAVMGDVVELYEGSTMLASTTLSASDIANGYVLISPDASKALMNDGAHSLTAKVKDNASIPNESALAHVTLSLDTTSPNIVSAATSSDGAKVILTYNEPLSATTVATSAFTVKVGDSPRTVNLVSVSGSTISLTLDSAVTNGQTVTVAYTDPTAGDDVNALQDASGNDALTLASTPVSNSTAAPAPPLYWISSLVADNFVAPTQKIYLYFPTNQPDAPLPSNTGLASPVWSAFTPAEASYTANLLESYVSSVLNISFEVVNSSEVQVDGPTVSFQKVSTNGLAGTTISFGGGNAAVYIKSGSDVAEVGPNIGVVLLHEFGHALGLQHPQATGLAVSTVTSTHLSSAEDSGYNTLMSYNFVAGVDGTQYQPFDLAALQKVYGVSPTGRTGNDTYVISAADASLIWDGDGIDTVDASAQTASLTFSLMPGEWNYFGSARSSLITNPGQSSINFGTKIENLIGGSGSDVLTGNDLNNRIEGRDGNDQISGGAGDDRLIGGAGNDTIEGGLGTDATVFNLARSQYTIMTSGDGYQIVSKSGTEGTDVVTGVEYFHFADGIYTAAALISGSPIANQTPQGGVTLTGTPKQGQTLTMAHNLSDADGLGTVGFQWLADGAPIRDATSSQLVLTEAQVGHVITARASYMDGKGSLENVLSSPTEVVANVDDPGSVSIYGATQVGLTVVAKVSDPDGVAARTYQWAADGVDIAGATGAEFVPLSAQANKALTVKVTYTDGNGTTSTLTSNPTGSVMDYANDATPINHTAATGNWTEIKGPLSKTGDPNKIYMLFGGEGVDYIYGADVSDVMLGLGGNDNLSTRAFDGYSDYPNTIDGGAGNDTIWGDRGNDVIFGGSGNDFIEGDRGADVIYGGEGDDRLFGAIDISPGTKVSSELLASPNNDDYFTNYIDGGSGNDWIGGRKGNDILVGGAGNDTIDGQGVNDLDTAVYSLARSKYVVVKAGEFFRIADTTGTDGVDLVKNVERFQFSDGVVLVDDLLQGNLNVNHAATGTVAISGSAVSGQVLTASQTLDDLDGVGTVSWQWFAGEAAITGASSSNFTLTDAQIGSQVSVRASYTDLRGYSEAVSSAPTQAVAALSAVPDAPSEPPPAWAIAGTDGADALNGTAGSDVLYGLGGKDTIWGNEGNDKLSGGVDNDTLYGGVGNDMLWGGAGDDSLIDSQGQDALYGGDGNDILRTSAIYAGSDSSDLLGDLLNGGLGDDTLEGGRGCDTLIGGDGIDTFKFASPLSGTAQLTVNGSLVSTPFQNKDVITDFVSGTDKIALSVAVFTGLTSGQALPLTALEMSATASTSQHRILYDASTGDLAFDRDGNGATYASAVFATLQNKPATLRVVDFVLIP